MSNGPQRVLNRFGVADREASENFGRILLILGLLLCCSGCGEEAAWVVQELTTDAAFRDIFFLTADRGWMVGGGHPVEGGIIGSTLDGGLTWSYQSGLIRVSPDPHAVHFQAVQFLDERRGFIAGGRGKILRTVDGGEHWHEVVRGGRHLSDLYFVDDQFGWAVGGSTLIRTTDGGETWKPPIPHDAKQAFSGRAIRFLNRDLGWAVGGAGAIYRSTDGGVSWTEQARPESGKPDLRALSFIDESRGWVVGEGGTVLYTDDGGESWSSRRTRTRWFLTGVHFIAPSTGWVVGFNRKDSSSVVLHTTDGGKTWTPQLNVEGEALFALKFNEIGSGWAVGERVRPYPQRLLRYVAPATAD